jgi:hypothetical protein
MRVAGGKPVPWTTTLEVGGPEEGDTVIFCALRLREASAVIRKKEAMPFRIDDCDIVSPSPS